MRSSRVIPGVSVESVITGWARVVRSGHFPICLDTHGTIDQLSYSPSEFASGILEIIMRDRDNRIVARENFDTMANSIAKNSH